MNLKDAFRYQKKLDSLIGEAEGILSNDSNVVVTTNTHLRSKVKAGEEDYVEVVTPASEYHDSINLVVDFLLHLLDEKENLYRAIAKAKASASFDIDSALAVNVKRQEIATYLDALSQVKASETTSPWGGTGYSFNAEGNQVTYRCGLKSVKTINFDRTKVRGSARHLQEVSDKTSSLIDTAMVTTMVEYEEKFPVNYTFQEVFEAFCQ